MGLFNKKRQQEQEVAYKYKLTYRNGHTSSMWLTKTGLADFMERNDIVKAERISNDYIYV